MRVARAEGLLLKFLSPIRKMFFALIMVVITGCWASVKSVDVKKAAQLLNESSNVFVLDARTLEEYQKEHLKGGIEAWKKSGFEVIFTKWKRFRFFCL